MPYAATMCKIVKTKMPGSELSPVKIHADDLAVTAAYCKDPGEAHT
ncbi:MAG: hypothetical protein QOJ11_3070 [Frankiales bacterium]|jgi:hypothetical protein|nr:hypothetical protein [Frankiales bacterium]